MNDDHRCEQFQMLRRAIPSVVAAARVTGTRTVASVGISDYTKTDAVTVSDMITPKAQFTQTFFENHPEIIASSWRVNQMAQLLANQAKLSLLSGNSEGTARPMEVIVSCTDEADLILKPGTPTAAETWDLVDAQLYNNDAGLELFQAACSRGAWKAQTFLSASSVQSYINYTDVNGRTPLFKAASQGDTLIVAQPIAARSNVDLAKTTDGTTLLFIAAQNGHASVTRQLIEARCNVDLALKTNGATPLHVAAFKGMRAS
jgi:ankyrin repeat protein